MKVQMCHFYVHFHYFNFLIVNISYLLSYYFLMMFYINQCI